MNKGTIYLLPCPIDAEAAPEAVLPAANFEIMRGLDYFVVENVRSARRFLSRAGCGPIDALEFVELSEHTRPDEVEAMLRPVLSGRNAGVISEAGVPAVADPGAEIVAAAHRHGVRVVPLVGPSSILMALMASGANGQSFAFNGYLPVKPPERTRAIRHFERRAATERQSQIFIETPYRNGALFAEFLAVCAPETHLTVAVDISGAGETIRTATIAEWRREAANNSHGSIGGAAQVGNPPIGVNSKGGVPELHKRPAIFIIG